MAREARVQIKKNKYEGIRVETLISLMQQNEQMWGVITQSCHLNHERIDLLYEIITGTAGEQQEDLTKQIYEYGSMIREQDLIARQIFLWLSGMIEN